MKRQIMNLPTHYHHKHTINHKNTDPSIAHDQTTEIITFKKSHTPKIINKPESHRPQIPPTHRDIQKCGDTIYRQGTIFIKASWEGYKLVIRARQATQMNVEILHTRKTVPNNIGDTFLE